MNNGKFAVQLYTLRHALTEDFAGTLREVKKMGWKAVQIDGLRGHSAEEVKDALRETNLKVAGMHISPQRMVNDLDAVVYEGLLFGTKTMFCHYLEPERQNESGYREIKSQLLGVADKLAKLGWRVGYHNHEFEFQSQVDGLVAHDYLMAPENNRCLYPEIDAYWVKYAGFDPLSCIEKYPYRIPILHLKDIYADPALGYPESLAEIGRGSIDFLPILQWGERYGVEYYAVEQDICPGNPLDSLAISLENLQRLAQKCA